MIGLSRSLCTDMHFREPERAGEPNARIFAVVAWREARVRRAMSFAVGPSLHPINRTRGRAT